VILATTTVEDVDRWLEIFATTSLARPQMAELIGKYDG